jgi:hypothetical protein
MFGDVRQLSARQTHPDQAPLFEIIQQRFDEHIQVSDFCNSLNGGIGKQHSAIMLSKQRSA